MLRPTLQNSLRESEHKATAGPLCRAYVDVWIKTCPPFQRSDHPSRTVATTINSSVWFFGRRLDPNEHSPRHWDDVDFSSARSRLNEVASDVLGNSKVRSETNLVEESLREPHRKLALVSFGPMPSPNVISCALCAS